MGCMESCARVLGAFSTRLAWGCGSSVFLTVIPFSSIFAGRGRFPGSLLVLFGAAMRFPLLRQLLGVGVFLAA